MWKVFIFCIELNRASRWTIVTSNKWPIGRFRMDSSDHHFTSHINNSSLSIFQISHLVILSSDSFKNRRSQKWTVKNYWSHWAVFKTENRLIANCGGSINWFIFTIHFHDQQLGGQKTYISSWPESFTDCRSPREKSWNIIWCIGIFWPKTCFTTHHQVLLKSFLEVICETTF